MRLTYTDIKRAHFRNIGKANQFGDDTLLEDFNYSLGQRYQLIFGALSSYINQDDQTSITIAGEQYYSYPVGTVGVDSATITVGSQNFTLSPIYDQYTWNMLNALTTQPSTFPQFIYPRKDDFGVWPIPQDTYDINFQRFFRDRNLSVEDYTTGTISLSSGSSTAVGSGTTFTNAMVGRWLTITDTTKYGQGYWYKVDSFTDATHLELQDLWSNASITGATYRIGETPEIPEEGHILLPAGTAADFYAGLRNEANNATWWNNVFWTGDGNNNIRDVDNKNVAGGLIGIIKRYKDRERDNIVQRRPSAGGLRDKIFSTVLS